VGIGTGKARVALCTWLGSEKASHEARSGDLDLVLCRMHFHVQLGHCSKAYDSVAGCSGVPILTAPQPRSARADSFAIAAILPAIRASIVFKQSTGPFVHQGVRSARLNQCHLAHSFRPLCMTPKVKKVTAADSGAEDTATLFAAKWFAGSESPPAQNVLARGRELQRVGPRTFHSRRLPEVSQHHVRAIVS